MSASGGALGWAGAGCGERRVKGALGGEHLRAVRKHLDDFSTLDVEVVGGPLDRSEREGHQAGTVTCNG